MLDCLCNKSARIFLNDHELKYIASFVESPLLIKDFEHQIKLFLFSAQVLNLNGTRVIGFILKFTN